MSDTPNRTPIGRIAGVAHAIVASMQRFPDIVGVQVSACDVTMRIVEDSALSRAAVSFFCTLTCYCFCVVGLQTRETCVCSASPRV